MISIEQLEALARGRLEDAEVLMRADRMDGAIYLGGFAVELALKVRICRTLGWESFMDAPSEFRGLESFRTHDLEILLRLSGQEERIRQEHLGAWSAVAAWTVRTRYNAIGTTNTTDAEALLSAAATISRVL